MSNYTFQAKHKNTGSIVSVYAVDNHFGDGVYGYALKARSGKLLYFTADELAQNYQRIGESESPAGGK